MFGCQIKEKQLYIFSNFNLKEVVDFSEYIQPGVSYVVYFSQKYNFVFK